MRSQAALVNFDVFLVQLSCALWVRKAILFGRLLSGLVIPVVHLLSLVNRLSYTTALLPIARGINVAIPSSVYIVFSFVSDLARATPLSQVLRVRKLTYSVLTRGSAVVGLFGAVVALGEASRWLRGLVLCWVASFLQID